MIHNDANPANYLFSRGKVFALDFESSWNHAHPVHDLGIVSAEPKKYSGWNKHDPRRAEPYIGRFLWQYSRSQAEFSRVTQKHCLYL
jgi:thiamine kinase-like enzyme